MAPCAEPTTGPHVAQAQELERLLERRQTLHSPQVSSLATARRLLSVWHSVHIPLRVWRCSAWPSSTSAWALYFATLLH